MASEVTICNLALAHLGDSATVSSLYPPEGSAQAEHCSRFYPVARDTLLEMAAWNFATRRGTLAQVDNPTTTWLYAYAMPAGVVKALAVLPEGASDDADSVSYVIETDSGGNKIVLTNEPNAVLRYVALVTDTTRFSSLFTTALTWLLASMLAGPIIKGDTGAAEAQRCLAQFRLWVAQAEASDANQRRVNVQPVTPWMAGR